MRSAAYETILPQGPITCLPYQLVQTASRTSPFLMLALALPATAAALTPIWLIAQHEAFTAAMLWDHPQSALVLAAALVAWGFLFGWPLVARACRFGSCRHITMTADRVTVSEGFGPWRKTWSERLAAYDGLAHHIRASLSGTRHELILIHPEPARSVLLRADDKIVQSEIDRLAILLGCREIAPQLFYRRRQVGVAVQARPAPELATAA